MMTKLKKLTPNLVVEDVKQSALREFHQVPGVGKSIAEDLWNLGLRSVSDLKNQDPEDLYLRLWALQGKWPAQVPLATTSAPPYEIRSQTFGDKVCHPERSAGSRSPDAKILRCAQDDRPDSTHVRSWEVFSPHV